MTPECVVAAHQLAERVKELARDLGLGMNLQELPGALGVRRGGGGFTWALEHVVVGAGRVERATTEGAQAGTTLGAENEVVVIARPRDEIVEDDSDYSAEAALGGLDVEEATAEGAQAGSSLGADSDDVEVEIIVCPKDLAVEEGKDLTTGADLNDIEVEMMRRAVGPSGRPVPST